MRLALLLALLLAGCGGLRLTAPAPGTDETLQRDMQGGSLAYNAERPAEAIAQYQAALTRAQARDDIGAMGDFSYDLALSELDANAPDRALAVARSAREELERRGAAPFPALLLVEATALYRLGRPAEADATAQRVQAGADAQSAARAIFLRGLMADERGDEAGLASAAGALPASTVPALQADASELAARLDLRRRDWSRAVADAERAVTARRDALDYRGLSRALALAGAGAEGGGDSAAAGDFFLRAGRSAAAQNDNAMARPWLERASRLGLNQPVGASADALLQQIDRKAATSAGAASP